MALQRTTLGASRLDGMAVDEAPMQESMTRGSYHCPRVLIADHHVETRSVLKRMFERRGCEVFQCLCHHELHGMLSAFVEPPVLMEVEMIICHVRLAELAGLHVLTRFGNACSGPAIALISDESRPEVVEQAKRLPSITLVSDVYDHAEQYKMFRLLVKKHEQLSQSISARPASTKR